MVEQIKTEPIYLELINKYGLKHQVIKTIEELDELRDELNNFILEDFELEKVRGEIVDVQHMLKQMILAFFDNEEHFKLYLIEKQKLIRKTYLNGK